MTLLPNLQARFRQALAAFTDRPEPWLEMIRRGQDARFGDYQANFAMALGKQLNKKPRDWPPRSSPGSTWPISASRRKSPGRASSTCG